MAEGTKIRYVGAHKAIEIPALGIAVARGHQITVDDPALAASLLAQEENWRAVGAGKQESKQDGEAGS